MTAPTNDRQSIPANGRAFADDFEVEGTRAMRGPSLWRREPAIVCEVVPGSLATNEALVAATLSRLSGVFPSAHLTDAPRNNAGARLAGAIAELALGLQLRAGSDVSWSRVTASDDRARWTVAIEYGEEGVAIASVRAAARMVRAAAAGEAIDIDKTIADLSARFRREHLGPTASVIVDEACRRGIPVRRAPGESAVQLGLGRHQRRVDASMTDRTSVIATDITSDKSATKKLLARLGMPVPAGGTAHDVDDALEIAEDIGYPLLVKPLDANNGRGISGPLHDDEQLREAFPIAKAEHETVVVERCANGRDHRVLVVDGQVVAVTERVPAHVVGDGARTIRALVEETNLDPRRNANDPVAPLAPLSLDEITVAHLRRGTFTLDSVPDAGEVVYLRSTANISTGGTPVDRTDEIHPTNAAICVFAADAVGLDIAGIDVLTPDISVPFRENGAVIIEINASPGIRMHTEPERGTPRDAAGAIVDSLFPPGAETRIPVVAVTGTNGKTTTTRLIAHLLRSAGNRVGFTTTDGVYYEDHLLFVGDMTGPMGADMVLSNPRVDAAVLEAARGGILRAGLGFGECDVGVVLNVTADHLGLRGINTIEQLAAVKQVVVTAVREGGYAILNADDPLVYAMRSAARGEVVLFSTGGAGESAAIEAHVAAGGTALTVERAGCEAFVLHHGGSQTSLIAVADVPLTMAGAARFQVQNVAAAAAAAWAAGISAEVIRSGLTHFTSSVATTPGRMNIVKIAGATIVVDYAHNPAAIRALLEYSQYVDASRRTGVLSTPGDRRDEDIREVGSLGVGLDSIIFKEHPVYRRGREVGEIGKLMMEGFVSAGGDPARAMIVLDEGEAIAEVQRTARAGDLVLFVADDAEGVISALESSSGGETTT